MISIKLLQRMCLTAWLMAFCVPVFGAEGMLDRAFKWTGLGASEFSTTIYGGWSFTSRVGPYPRDYTIRTVAVISDEDHPFLLAAAQALAAKLSERPDIDSAVFYPPGGNGPHDGMIPDAWIHLHWEYLGESASFLRTHHKSRLTLYASNAPFVSRTSPQWHFFYQSFFSHAQSVHHTHTTQWIGGHRQTADDFADKAAANVMSSLRRQLKDGDMPSALRELTPETARAPEAPLIPLFEEHAPWAVGTRPLAEYYAIYKLDPTRHSTSIPHRVHLELAALGWHDAERFREGDSYYHWRHENQIVTVHIEDPITMLIPTAAPPPNREYHPMAVIEHIIMTPDDAVRVKVAEHMTGENCPVDYLLTMRKYIDGDPDLMERFHELLLTTHEETDRIYLARADYWAERGDALREWEALREAAKRQFTQSGGPSALERLKTFGEERPGFTPPRGMPAFFEEMGARRISQGEFVFAATVEAMEPFILYQVEEDGSVNYVSIYVTADPYTELYPGFWSHYFVSGRGNSGASSGGMQLSVPWDDKDPMDDRSNAKTWSVQTVEMEDGRYRIQVRREAR